MLTSLLLQDILLLYARFLAQDFPPLGMIIQQVTTLSLANVASFLGHLPGKRNNMKLEAMMDDALPFLLVFTALSNSFYQLHTSTESNLRSSSTAKGLWNVLMNGLFVFAY